MSVIRPIGGSDSRDQPSNDEGKAKGKRKGTAKAKSGR